MASVPDNLRITTDFTLRLCTLLRQSGVAVGTQQTIASVRSIALFETITETQLKGIYRATLVNRKQDLAQLDRAYDLLMQDYLRPRGKEEEPPRDRNQKTILVKTREYAGVAPPAPEQEESAQTEGYSAIEVDRQKDFRLVSARDVPDYVAALEKVARRYATIARRKTSRTRRSRSVDLRASLRASVKSGGEVLQLCYRKKSPTRARFVLVCDVSGSMEIYGVFLLNFLHQLNRLRRLRIESFVFSTKLQPLTRQFRSRSFPEMLRDVAANFTGWSGGTKIGAAIETLNETYATSVTPKTTVLIMSDGWDTGEVGLLDHEMARLRRRARAILWINPLKGDVGYEPLAAGMAAARPYCDHFVAGHNIESFMDLARLVRP